jgi:hypothetical protein
MGRPVAVESQRISTRPVNLSVGGAAILLFRDPVSNQVRAFDRRLEEDLIPQFKLNRDERRRPQAYLIDADTNTGWSVQGIAVDGNSSRKGQKLRALAVEDNLYWGVMKYWYPDLILAEY